MKRINWVVMSALVMGLSVQASDDTDHNPNRKRAVPCCSLGKTLKAIPVACLALLASLNGAKAEDANTAVVVKSVNSLPAGLLIDQGVPCYGVKGKLMNDVQVCLKALMCKNPAAQSPEAEQFEKGRLVGHIERLAKGHYSNPPRLKLKELNIVEKRCDWGEKADHVQNIQCVRNPEALGHNDLAFGLDCGK